MVGGLFIVAAGILVAPRWFRGTRDYSGIGMREGLITGLGQGIGVLPGISRSGITTASSLAAGIARELAGEYSFLVAIPAIIGALAVKLPETHPLRRRIGRRLKGFRRGSRAGRQGRPAPDTHEALAGQRTARQDITSAIADGNVDVLIFFLGPDAGPSPRRRRQSPPADIASLQHLHGAQQVDRQPYPPVARDY